MAHVNKSIKVKQLTVDSMKQMGMAKALEKANSGSADGEFVEAAKRFYGNRVRKDAANYRGQVSKDAPAVIEDKRSGGTVSNRYKGAKKDMA